MKQFKNRVYLSRAISGLGDWMTLLASALWISEKFGPGRVPYGFLIASVPHLLFSRVLANKLQAFDLRKIYFLSQIALAVNVAILATGNATLLGLYVYLGVASTISAISRPTWDALLGFWFEGKERQEVFVRVGAMMSSLLILAPISGGALSQWIGYRTVFLVDAASFILGLLVLSPELFSSRRVVRPRAQQEAQEELQPLSERNLNPHLQSAIIAWYGLLILGALINGVEYLVFKNFDYSPSQVGLVIASWGGGGLLSFLFSKRLPNSQWMILAPIALGTVLGGFLLANGLGYSCALFLSAGFLNAHCGGKLRAEIQNRIDSATASIRVWALLNQRLSIINILGYLLCGLALSKVSLAVTASLMLAVAIVCSIASYVQCPEKSG